jgi:hypothetical protein
LKSRKKRKSPTLPIDNAALECVAKTISNDKHDQLLAELTEILYSYFQESKQLEGLADSFDPVATVDNERKGDKNAS